MTAMALACTRNENKKDDVKPVAPAAVDTNPLASEIAGVEVTHFQDKEWLQPRENLGIAIRLKFKTKKWKSNLSHDEDTLTFYVNPSEDGKSLTFSRYDGHLFWKPNANNIPSSLDDLDISSKCLDPECEVREFSIVGKSADWKGHQITIRNLRLQDQPQSTSSFLASGKVKEVDDLVTGGGWHLKRFMDYSITEVDEIANSIDIRAKNFLIKSCQNEELSLEICRNKTNGSIDESLYLNHYSFHFETVTLHHSQSLDKQYVDISLRYPNVLQIASRGLGTVVTGASYRPSNDEKVPDQLSVSFSGYDRATEKSSGSFGYFVSSNKLKLLKKLGEIQSKR